MQLRLDVRVFPSLVAVAVLTGCSMCTAQHDPTRDRQLFTEEAKTANAVQPKLTADGKFPQAPGAAAPVDPITGKYNQFCVPCHGSEGKGDGLGAAALNPKPRNFSDKAWQKSADDARIAKVIKEGGASVGLSANMAAWGAVVNDEEINGLVVKIRGFGK